MTSDMQDLPHDPESRVNELEAELRRLHSFDGLLELLDEHWPASAFPTTRVMVEADRDAGARIASLIRWVAELRPALRALHDASSDFIKWYGQSTSLTEAVLRAAIKRASDALDGQ